MSKITFRADDDLIEAIESFDSSKSEVLREALRTYLDAHARVGSSDAVTIERSSTSASEDLESIDALVDARVDELVEQRVRTLLDRELKAQDLNLTLSFDGERAPSVVRRTPREPESDHDHAGEESCQCGQCGEELAPSHVFCPNCGEKASRRVFCDCGDEVRSDWRFCPSCGRRTPAADVLNSE